MCKDVFEFYSSYSFLNIHSRDNILKEICIKIYREIVMSNENEKNKRDAISKILDELEIKNTVVLNSNEFANFFYWCTDFPMHILNEKTEKNLINKGNYPNKDIIKNDICYIYTRCSKCSTEIVYYPIDRKDRKTYLEKYFEHECNNCLEKEQEVKEELRIQHEEGEKRVKEEGKQKEEYEKYLKEEYIKRLKSLPYKDYLLTDHWKEVRKRKLKQAHYKCELCNSIESLHVHHKTYENRGNEKDEDLIVLCKSCHEKQHNKNKDSTNNIKTQFFIYNSMESQEYLSNQINFFLEQNTYSDIVDIKLSQSNNIYSALLIYKT